MFRLEITGGTIVAIRRNDPDIGARPGRLVRVVHGAHGIATR